MGRLYRFEHLKSSNESITEGSNHEYSDPLFVITPSFGLMNTDCMSRLYRFDHFKIN